MNRVLAGSPLGGLAVTRDRREKVDFPVSAVASPLRHIA